MNREIAAAVIIALALVITGFLVGGRYTIVAVDSSTVARLDRFSGEVAMCVPGTRAECEWMLDAGPADQNSN